MTCQVIVDLKPETPCGQPVCNVGSPDVPVPMCQDHWERWAGRLGLKSPTLVVFDSLAPRLDYEPLGENCDNACMLPWSHDDGRMCHYHARLDAWVTRGSDGPLDQRCLRNHPSVESLMRVE